MVDRLIKKGIETVIVDNVSGASGLTYMNPAAVLYKYDIRDETLHEVFNLENQMQSFIWLHRSTSENHSGTRYLMRM